MERRTIVALGGGGFSMEPRNLRLDRFVLSLARTRRPEVCFVPTASGDADGYIRRFYRAFRRLRCRPSHLSLFKPPRDLRGFVLSRDVIYVGGGNTRNLLTLWRDWGLDRLLREAWRRGTVLAGISAGALCWFEEGVTDSTGALTPLRCLGFLPGSHCPHYDGERGRRPEYRKLVRTGRLKPGLAADDGAALHFEGRRFVGAVSSRRHARAWRVDRAGETEIVPHFLDPH
ncbi:MAG: peptidase E [Planctomycetes bacterium]|nr:peptidase E [Planctomycetota bacterium]